MAWNEVVAARGQRRKVYVDPAQPGRVRQTSSLARLHYESELDSGAFDAPIDMTPERVQTAALDGWRITNADYHFGLGLRDDGRDGWVGFGGRQGAHQFWFRLERALWVHWPTRGITQIGAVANYNRANLTRETRTRTLPTGETLNLETLATWRGLWSGVDVRWRAHGDKLKEEISISQAARDTLVGAYPGSPTNETYLMSAFRLDVSDLPRMYKNDILQDLTGDFSDDGTTPLMGRDALDRLLFFLPLDDAIVYDENGVKLARTRLRKRIYRAGGITWLLIGLRADTLAGLPAGELVFDPTIEVDVAATADDGWCVGASFDNDDNQLILGDWFGSVANSFTRHLGITILAGDTIDESYVEFTANASNSATTVDLTVAAADSADAAAPTSCAGFTGYTTATVAWNNVEAFVDGNLHQTPSLNTIIQELVDDYAGLDDAAVVIFVLDNGSTQHRRASQVEFSAAEAAMLHIVHSSAGGGAQTITPSAIASAEAFGSGALAPGAVAVAPDAVASAEAFGTLSLNLQVTASAIASLEAFGDHTLSPGAVSVAPAGIASAEAFGTHVLNLQIVAQAIASSEAFGAHALALAIIANAIGSAEAFGAATIVGGATVIAPVGIISAEAFGAHALAVGAVTILPAGVASGEAFGVQQLNMALLAEAIASGEAFGDAAVAPGAIAVAPAGIASGEEFGTLTIFNVGAGLAILPAGIISAEAFGTLALIVIAASRVYYVPARDRTYDAPAIDRTYDVPGA